MCSSIESGPIHMINVATRSVTVNVLRNNNKNVYTIKICSMYIVQLGVLIEKRIVACLYVNMTMGTSTEV